jgi:hypothetical protein
VEKLEFRENWEERVEERRNYRRFPVPGAAGISRGREFRGLYWLKDLGMGGALLTGREPLEVGERLRFDLHLGWANPISLRGSVVRSDTVPQGSCQIGVAFRTPSRSVKVMMRASLANSAECDKRMRVPTVLVVSQEQQMRRSLEEHLGSIGRKCVTVSNPLESLRWFQDWESEIDLLMIDFNLDSELLLPYLRYLQDTRPYVRRIAISESPLSGWIERFASVESVLRNPHSLGAVVNATFPLNTSPDAA